MKIIRILMTATLSISIILLLAMITAAVSQLVLSSAVIQKDCVDINADYTIQKPVYEYELISWPNKTIENRSTFLRYDDVLVKNTITECEETLLVDSKTVDFKLQGYKCSDITGEIICDNDVNNGGKDGNGDGTCQSGETCCKVTDGKVTCKNGVETWTERSHALPVAKLEVR